MPGEACELCPSGFGNAKRRESCAAIAKNGRHSAVGLDVIQDGGALERANDSREGWADARDAALAFERFEQRRFFAALVCARAAVRVSIERKIGAEQIFSQIPAVVGCGDGFIQNLDQVAILAAHIDVAGVRIYGEGGNQHAFDQLMRVIFDEDAVLTRTGLTLIGVHHDILGLG